MPSRTATETRERVQRSRERAAEKLASIRRFHSSSTLDLSNCERLLIELVKEGLAENNFPMFQRAEAAWGMFASDRELQILGAGVAAISPYAWDYIQQLPALVVPMTLGRDMKIQNARFDALRTVKLYIQDGPKLKWLAKDYGIIPQLRKLKATHLRVDYNQALLALSRLNPSLVSQEIPLEHQSFWLREINVWARRAFAPELFEWAVLNNPKETTRDLYLITDLIDYIDRVGFNLKSSWNTLLRLSDAWHTQLAQERVLERDGRDDTVVNYAPFQNVYEPVDGEGNKQGMQIVALNTQQALIEEATSMHHCVDGYWRRVKQGQCRIFSIRYTEGGTIATVELIPYRDTWKIQQIKGLRNKAVGSHYTEIMLTYIRERSPSAPISPYRTAFNPDWMNG